MLRSRSLVTSLALAVGTFVLAVYSSGFALHGEAASPQNPPRDRRPGQAAPETARERELKQALDDKRIGPYIELARLQQGRSAFQEAESTLISARQAFPTDVQPLQMLATHYRQSGQLDKAGGVLEDIAKLNASDKQSQHVVAMFYWDRISKDQSLTPEQKRPLIQSGLAAADRALALDPDFITAIGYRGLLLRALAAIEPNPATQESLIAEAQAHGNRAAELTKAKSPTATGAPAQPAAERAVPIRPPAYPGNSAGFAPVRVGGNIRAPAKTKDVRPIYPEDALAAKVQGVVIIEATIDPQGLVSDARVLRGVPLLDQAAVDAVSQWEFQPTLVNGTPVPVIMTVTVNFTAQ
jgi:TonB family protein